MAAIWDEMSSCKKDKPLDICPCIQEELEDKIIQFVIGISDSYNTTKSAILMLDPPPSLDKTYAILQQDE